MKIAIQSEQKKKNFSVSFEPFLKIRWVLKRKRMELYVFSGQTTPFVQV